MLNYSDVIYQFLMLLFLIAIIIAVVIIVKTILTKKVPQQSNAIDKKLDRIIELLEKDKTI
jgi:peptidoglycan biosynthesis protein MviN/MurJ (putative lipid II flippase)